MNTRAYELKTLTRQNELAWKEPSTPTKKAINDLEMIICGIKPYSRWWRWGYIKSLRMAIKALKESGSNDKVGNESDSLLVHKDVRDV